MQTKADLANFLELRSRETGNRNYDNACFKVRHGVIIDPVMKSEFESYSLKIEEARSPTDTFKKRMADAQEKIQICIEEGFPTLDRFYVGFNWNRSIYVVTLILDLTCRPELQFSLFTVESDQFKNSFGAQLMRALRREGESIQYFLPLLFVAHKYFEISFTELELCWKHLLVSPQDQRPFRDGEVMKFFRLLDSTGVSLLNLNDDRKKLLLMERGSYDGPDQKQILPLFVHQEPYYRNVFFSFYQSHIILTRELLEKELPNDLIIVILCQFIYYDFSLNIHETFICIKRV